jgi:hypothetical protein
MPEHLTGLEYTPFVQSLATPDLVPTTWQEPVLGIRWSYSNDSTESVASREPIYSKEAEAAHCKELLEKARAVDEEVSAVPHLDIPPTEAALTGPQYVLLRAVARIILSALARNRPSIRWLS